MRRCVIRTVARGTDPLYHRKLRFRGARRAVPPGAGAPAPSSEARRGPTPDSPGSATMAEPDDIDENEPGQAFEEAVDDAPTPPRGKKRGAGTAEGGLVRYDPLRAYLAEVSRHPVLSREEEHEIAVHYRETGDVEAAYKLVASNLRLVVKIAHEYRRTAFQLLDLVQEGNLGLMQAVKKYDPWKGVKLSSYAAWWIRAYIIRFIMENWRMVKLGTTQAQRKLFFNLAKEREKLLARGIEPTPRLLAKNLQVEESEVEEMTGRMASEDLSLDAPLRGDDGDSRQTGMDRVPALDGVGADDRMADEELRRIFREKLGAFAETIEDEKERYIFEHRLLPPEGTAPLTLQEIGTHFKLTRERARQIEAKLTNRLREFLRAEIPDFELLGPPQD